MWYFLNAILSSFVVLLEKTNGAPGNALLLSLNRYHYYLNILKTNGFQLVFTRVPYRGSHPQPMSLCLGSRHISHFSLLYSGQYNRKYISGRNSTNRKIEIELDFLKSDTIGSQKYSDFFMTADGVMSPAKIGNVVWRKHVSSELKTAAKDVLIVLNDRGSILPKIW